MYRTPEPFELHADTKIAIRKHILSVYPKEACGIITQDLQFVPVKNISDKPMDAFMMPNGVYTQYQVRGVIHSHNVKRYPNFWPSKTDMECQAEALVPFAIYQTDGVQCSEPLWWGDYLLETQLHERPFIHGVYDCFALGRAYFKQVKNVYIKPWAYERDWETHDANFIEDHFSEVGFERIRKEDAKPGDVMMMAIKTRVPNHIGIILPGNLLLHHLVNRFSGRTPIGAWSRFAVGALRYVA
jgi:proteasome lid subunit RPN8/RPN11